MTVALAVTVWVVLALIAVVRPRFGAILIWFMTWSYPNTLLFGTLPLNARLDDLWVVFMFVVCLISPQSRKTTGLVVWLALAWWLSVLIYIPMTAYILSSLLHKPEHLESHLRWMCIAAAVAGAIAIGSVYFPYQFEAFLPPITLSGMTGVEQVEAVANTEARRAGGSLGIVPLGMLMMNISLLSLAMVVYRVRPAARTFYATICGACLVTLAYTISRGAIVGLIGAVCWALVFARRRAAFVLVAIGASVVLLLQGGLVERVLARFSGGATPYATTFEEGLAGRLDVLRIFIENLSPAFFLTGIGMPSASSHLHATAHSAYLGALVYSGIPGLVVLVLAIHRGVVLGRRAVRVPADRTSQALGTYMLMLVVGMMVVGLSAESFQLVWPAQLYFAALVFAERGLAQVPAAPLTRLVRPPPMAPGLVMPAIAAPRPEPRRHP
jgi:hypothetical protein